MGSNKKANSDHGHLLEQQLGHTYGVRLVFCAGEIREKDHVPSCQADSENSGPIQLIALHNEKAEYKHQDLRRVINERKDDEVLVQSLLARVEVAAPENSREHDVVASMEVILGHSRLRKSQQTIKQKREG